MTEPTEALIRESAVAIPRANPGSGTADATDDFAAGLHASPVPTIAIPTKVRRVLDMGCL